MKRPYFISLFFLLLLVICFVLTRYYKAEKNINGCEVTNVKKRKTDTSVYASLTAQDRINYTIEIDQSKITMPDEITLNTGNKKYSRVNVPVTLSNRSCSVLRYTIMTCSWYDQFCISNKNLQISRWPCDGNFSAERVLAANAKTVFNIPIMPLGKFNNGDKFKIGMNLLISDDHNGQMMPLDLQKFNDKNLIWSNEVEMP